MTTNRRRTGGSHREVPKEGALQGQPLDALDGKDRSEASEPVRHGTSVRRSSLPKGSYYLHGKQIGAGLAVSVSYRRSREKPAVGELPLAGSDVVWIDAP